MFMAVLSLAVVVSCEILPGALVELRVARFDLRTGARAEDFVRPRCVDAFAVHRHPRGHALDDGHFPVVGHAAVRQWEVQQEIAIAADDIHKHVDDALRGLVLGAGIVVPVADARVRLPRARPDAVDHAALYVEHAHAGLRVGPTLAGVDCLDLAAVTAHAGVVEMGDDGKAILSEWSAAIRIKQVGLMLIHDIQHAVEVVDAP